MSRVFNRIFTGVVVLFAWAFFASIVRADVPPPAWMEGNSGHTSTRLADGTILVTGGSNVTLTPSDQADVFDGTAGTFTATGNLSAPRSGHSATLLLDGRVLVAGGTGDGQDALDSLEVYEPATMGFSPLTATLLSPRKGHTATVLADGRVLIQGGSDADGPLATAEIFDPSNDSVAAASSLAGLTMATLATDKNDYVPGEHVVVSGAGFAPGEAVALVFDENPVQHEPRVVMAVADSGGAISDGTYLIDSDDVGTAFTLTATGLTSGMTAVVQFKDGAALTVQSMTVTAPTGAVDRTIDFGQQITVSVTFLNTSTLPSTTNTQFTVDASLALPTGWTQVTTNPPSFVVPIAGTATKTWNVIATSSGVLRVNAHGTPQSPITCTSSGLSCDATAGIDITTVNATSLGVLSFAPAAAIIRPGASTLTAIVTNSAASPGAAGKVVNLSSPMTITATGTAAASCNPPGGGPGTIAAGTGRVFTYACTLSGNGVVTFTTSATGTDENSGAALVTATKSTTVTVDNVVPTLQMPSGVLGQATSTAGGPVSYTVTATDNLAGATAVCTPASGSAFPFGTTDVHCTATDVAGNSSTGSFQVTVGDKVPPVLSGVPSSFSVEATLATGTVVTYSTPGAVDAVDGTRPVTCSPASGSSFSLGATTVTCSSTDAHANTATASFTVTVADTTAPTLTLPSSLTAEATGATGTAVTYTATANDSISGSVAASCSPASGATFAFGTTTVSCSASDGHGNATTGTFTVTVADTTPPSLALPSPATTEATSASGATVTYAATASDTVSGNVTTSCAPTSGATFAIGATTVTCSATDGHGNTATGTFQITVADTHAPTLTLPSSLSAEATGASGAAVTYTATANDTISGSVAATCSPASGATFAFGTTTVSCSASDGHGNTATGTFTVTIADTTAPAITAPTGASAEAISAVGAPILYAASAQDVVDGHVAVGCVPASGSVFPVGLSTVVCTTTDAHGNTSAVSFPVSVLDSTPPTLTLSADRVSEAQGPAGAAVDFTATASDLVSGAVTVTCSPASGATFALGVTTVSCSGTDAHGNTATGTFKVTVDDTIAPALTLPASASAEAVSPSGAPVTFAATALDLVDGALAASCTPASGATFALGTSLVMCSTVDAAGNVATGTFPVTVNDTTAPTLHLPIDVSIEATSASGATVGFTATADDLVSGALAVACSPAADSAFPLGPTTVVCRATDAQGNLAEGSFLVTVNDSTAPTLSLPSPMTIEATGAAGAMVAYASSATDAVSGAVSVTCTPASGSEMAVGDTTVTCIAGDTAGNDATGTFLVHVVDTTPPSLRLPADLFVEATGPSGAAVAYSGDAIDLVDGLLPITCSSASDSTFALAETTVTCTSTDAHGNVATGTFEVTVEDTTAPTLTLPAAIVVNASSSSGASVSYVASAADLVDGPVAIACSAPSGATFPMGMSTSVTCTATDSRGNTATEAFSVTVADMSAPVLTVPVDLIAEATGPSGAPVAYVPVAFDLVDGIVPVQCSPATGSPFALDATALVTCSATDHHGNTATGKFHVTVVDTKAPALALPTSRTLEATGPTGATTTFTATATDLVSGAVPVTCSKASGATFALGANTVTCTSTDAHGNIAAGSFTVTVVDTTPPVVTVPSTINVNATAATGATVSFTVTAKDLVSGTVTATCSRASGSLFPVGTTVVTCTATDTHARTGSASFNVIVTYDTSGFCPGDHDGDDDDDDHDHDHDHDHGAHYKRGGTVPVKFDVDCHGGSFTNVTPRLYLAKITNGVVGATVIPVSSGNSNTGNYYKRTGNHYTYNLSTSPLTVGTWQLRTDLGDGVLHTLAITLK